MVRKTTNFFWETRCMYGVQWENGCGGWAPQEQLGRRARRWMMRLERSSGRVLKGVPQFWDRAERGATVAADVCLLGVAEQKVEIFCLPGFVEDRRQMCFSRGSPSHFFLHMRMLREEGNRGGKRSERENNNEAKLMTSNKRNTRMLMRMMMALFVWPMPCV